MGFRVRPAFQDSNSVSETYYVRNSLRNMGIIILFDTEYISGLKFNNTF